MSDGTRTTVAPPELALEPIPCSVVLSALDGERAILRVGGELDASTTPALERTVARLCGRTRVVHLDLAGVTFADVAAFRMLLWLCIAPYGCNDVRVVASSPAIRRLVGAALDGFGAPPPPRGNPL